MLIRWWLGLGCLVYVFSSSVLAETPTKAVMGLTEQVHLVEFGLTLEGKLDTGADNSSLSAINVERFTRNGERWVRFELPFPGFEGTPIERPLQHTVRIVRRAADVGDEDQDFARRAVIELTLCMGERHAVVPVNLADRRRFRTPLLVGAGSLSALGVLVDSAADSLGGKPACVVREAPSE